jgi:hypothetical protein
MLAMRSVWALCRSFFSLATGARIARRGHLSELIPVQVAVVHDH